MHELIILKGSSGRAAIMMRKLSPTNTNRSQGATLIIYMFYSSNSADKLQHHHALDFLTGTVELLACLRREKEKKMYEK